MMAPRLLALNKSNGEKIVENDRKTFVSIINDVFSFIGSL